MNNLIPLARPPWPGIGRRLESHTRKALYDYEMVKDVEKVAVALSGGKDSVTLLFMLAAIRGRGFPPFELHAIHIAGDFTCGAGVNGDYLAAICRELSVNLIVREEKQELSTLKCYSCSRRRRTLLFEAAKEVGAHTVAFGHHRDDNAQTLLMNLLQKGEFAGMLPKLKMHHYDVTIIRPLIYATENEIRDFAKQAGFARISCRCPVGQKSKRKEVDRLLDEMETIYPNVRNNIALAALQYGSEKAKGV